MVCPHAESRVATFLGGRTLRQIVFSSPLSCGAQSIGRLTATMVDQAAAGFLKSVTTHTHTHPCTSTDTRFLCCIISSSVRPPPFSLPSCPLTPNGFGRPPGRRDAQDASQSKIRVAAVNGLAALTRWLVAAAQDGGTAPLLAQAEELRVRLPVLLADPAAAVRTAAAKLAEALEAPK